WYTIDPLFTRNTSLTPSHIRGDKTQQSNHYVREVFENEIFPYKQTTVGLPTNIPTLDLAFYPKERGPYNFDALGSVYTAGLNSDGSLKSPETRWGGIMRKMETSDFESANIEFVEFWMLDPFIYNTDNTQKGGDLYLNLGNVSEDLLRDSRKSFEQGLPTPQQQSETDNTTWGRVSRQQALVNAFDNNSQSRKLQDVGLDGLGDSDEKSFYSEYLKELKQILNPKVYQKFEDDPSNDDYHYFRGQDMDEEQAPILLRYKKINNTEGNSPTQEQSPESYPTAATNTPDTEDINDDNTLNENESYYQYKVSIRPEDMALGKNFITDIKEATVTLKNGIKSTIKWYQFKIPVKSPQRVVGSISDFKSIRFMRMFLKGFQDSVIMRFATLDLVRADWRNYSRELTETETISNPDTQFDISAVNIEENGNRKPVNYILPPGIDRVIDPQNPQLRQLNEQSMVFRTKNLSAGDARAAYKTLNLDVRRYKKLQMDVHAEAIDGYSLYDDDLSLFIRMGSDFTNNYYEYEIPLKLTKPGFYNGSNLSDRLIVWPEDNHIAISLEQLPEIKQKRNDEMHRAGSSVHLTDRYSYSVDNSKTIYVKGNPNTAQLSIVMIGVRNKKNSTSSNGPKSGEIWVNELRLTDFDEKGGWAAQGRLSLRLADLGNVSISARTQQAGFGGIEQKVNERAKDNLYEYDIASNVELGKLFPKKSGVQIPLYVAYSKTVINPEYNPLDPDVKLKDALSAAESAQQRDSIRNISQDYTTRKSINLTNLRIDKTNQNKAPRFYDISNFSATYSFSEVYKRNVNTAYNVDRSQRGLLSYNFTANPEPLEPFKNIKLFNNKLLQIIRDFNFYLAPIQISYRNDMYRHYNEVQERNISNPDMIIPTTFDKEFIWNRFFDLRHNVTKSLRIDISTQGTAQIDEPLGRISRETDDYKAKRDTILRNLFRGGRPIQYHHTINASYMLPINKLPFMDWVSANMTYQGIYDWSATQVRNTKVDYGNTISNSGATQIAGQFNIMSLYNKVPFLSRINQKTESRSSRYDTGRGNRGRSVQGYNPEGSFRYKSVEYKAQKIRLKANSTKIFSHRLDVDSVEVIAKDSKGNKISGEVRPMGRDRVAFTPSASADNVTILFKGKKEVETFTFDDIAEKTIRALMGIRNISFSYTDANGTVVPGFLPKPRFFGNSTYTPDQSIFSNISGSSYAPGLPFVLGWQDNNFAGKAAKRGWLTTDITRNDPVIYTHTETFNMRVTIEPVTDLKIELNADRTYSQNISEIYQYDSNKQSFNVLNHNLSGSFTMSINTLGTSFSSIGSKGVDRSKAYNKFLENRLIISQRLAGRRVNNPLENYNTSNIDLNTNFPDGYGPTSTEVLIPAFLAAYTDKSPEKISLSPFPSIRNIMPNWRITYEGNVSQVSWLKDYLTSLSFTHQYRATYDVGSFLSNAAYDDAQYGDGFSYIRDKSNNFIPQNDIAAISINEQFSPLIDVEANWVNKLTSHVGLKRMRNLNLSFANNQLTEINSNEVEVGLGYRFEKLDLILKTKNKQKALSNDLNVRMDLNFQKNKTSLRKIVEQDDQVTAGNNIITVKTYADYMLSDRFQLRVFYDKQITKPYTSLSYETSTTNFGMSFRFTLTQ
ncbi:MAG: cell surface protein SprA, partial [Bacteroidota bacterium]|nr:cell surface protein SprA [Bacteroidota bacterium]